MAILNTCCCWRSVRDGSFACGIYTMIFYTLVVTVGTFHLTPVIDNQLLFAFGLIALCLSGLCVMSSALLLVGLCADNRAFLVPWIVCILLTTLMDIFLSIYFIIEDSRDPVLAVLFVTDIIVCALNIYCILCVISQYQEYSAGRGRPEDCIRIEPEPEIRCMRFNWPSFQALNGPSPEPAEQPEKEPTGPFLDIPGVSKSIPREPCHKWNDSVGSCAKNSPSTRSVETEDLPSCS